MKLSLQSQIFFALIAFGALFAAVLGANEELFRRGLTDQRHLGLAHEVTLRAEDLERRGRAYAAVAPRDFEAYGRDVIVFYASLRADLESLKGAVDALVQVRGASAPDTANAIDAMRESYARFVLRELSRRDLRTLALVLLRDADGTPHRVLAFAWADADAENAGVARFLGGLSRFFGRLLIGSVPRPQQAAARA
ncbi:MAG: hypothetical protein ABIH12_00950 [Pseudomonadota bacterium]